MYGTPYASKARISFEEMFASIDQLEAWRQILNTYIPNFKEKSVKFKSPFREDTHAGCVLKNFKGKLLFMDSADSRFHGKNCVEALSIIKNIEWTKAINMLFNDSQIGSMDIPKFFPKVEPSEFIFRVSFDYRAWGKIDHQRFTKLGLTFQHLVAENWRPIKKLSFNSRNNPDILSTSHTQGYAIEILGRHKIYCPGEAINFLSTVPVHTVAGISKLDYSKPLFINKSAKDHVVVSVNEYNSRFIVNGENDKPDDIFIIAAAKKFPKIFFLYDNDQTGITNAIRWASESNELTSTDKFRAIWLPEEKGQKDPAEWIEKFHNLDIINKLSK